MESVLTDIQLLDKYSILFSQRPIFKITFYYSKVDRSFFFNQENRKKIHL